MWTTNMMQLLNQRTEREQQMSTIFTVDRPPFFDDVVAMGFEEGTVESAVRLSRYTPRPMSLELIIEVCISITNMGTVPKRLCLENVEPGTETFLGSKVVLKSVGIHYFVCDYDSVHKLVFIVPKMCYPHHVFVPDNVAVRSSWKALSDEDIEWIDIKHKPRMPEFLNDIHYRALPAFELQIPELIMYWHTVDASYTLEDMANHIIVSGRERSLPMEWNTIFRLMNPTSNAFGLMAEPHLRMFRSGAQTLRLKQKFMNYVLERVRYIGIMKNLPITGWFTRKDVSKVFEYSRDNNFNLLALYDSFNNPGRAMDKMYKSWRDRKCLPRMKFNVDFDWEARTARVIPMLHRHSHTADFGEMATLAMSTVLGRSIVPHFYNKEEYELDSSMRHALRAREMRVVEEDDISVGDYIALRRRQRKVVGHMLDIDSGKIALGRVGTTEHMFPDGSRVWYQMDGRLQDKPTVEQKPGFVYIVPPRCGKTIMQAAFIRTAMEKDQAQENKRGRGGESVVAEPKRTLVVCASSVDHWIKTATQILEGSAISKCRAYISEVRTPVTVISHRQFIKRRSQFIRTHWARVIFDDADKLTRSNVTAMGLSGIRCNSRYVFCSKIFKDMTVMYDWMKFIGIGAPFTQVFVNFMFNRAQPTYFLDEYMGGVDIGAMKRIVLKSFVYYHKNSEVIRRHNVNETSITITPHDNEIESAFESAQASSRNTRLRKRRLAFMFNVHPRLVPLSEYGVVAEGNTSQVPVYKQRMDDVLRELKNLSETTKETLADIENVKCSICLDAIERPAITQCGHVFCKGCIEHAMRANTQHRCPLCRERCGSIMEITEVAAETLIVDGKVVEKTTKAMYENVSRGSYIFDDIVKRCQSKGVVIYSRYKEILDAVYDVLVEKDVEVTKVKRYTSKTEFKGTVLLYRTAATTPLEVFTAGEERVNTVVILDPEIDNDEARHIVGRTMRYVDKEGSFKKNEVKLNIVTYVK